MLSPRSSLLELSGEYAVQDIIYPPGHDENSSSNSLKNNGEHTSPDENELTEPTCAETDTAKSDVVDTQLKELNPVYLPEKFEKLPDNFDPNEFPSSYRSNNAKEARLIEYCENFRRQFASLCPDRMRLLLSPLNECQIPKFVCTTLHPIQLSYPELYNWEGAASFVSDFLDFVPLVPSTELPKRLLSPMTTVNIQKGNSFEYATLLCSILLGVGYDAYVVSGYATRECCYRDETRLVSPFRVKPMERQDSDDDTESRKYIVRPPRDLTSQYEKAKLAKELQAEVEKNRLAEEQAELNDEEACKPPIDPLYGLRIHAWVLIRPGKRDVTRGFFIETLTGLSHPLESPMYLGIESIWNSENYWVNMQDCSDGISSMSYNLKDGQRWEYLLPSGSLDEEKLNRMGASPIPDANSEWPRPEGHLHVHSTLNFELMSQDSTESSHIAPSSGITSRKPKLLQHTSSIGDGPLKGRDGMTNSTKPLATLEDKLLLMDLPPSWTLPIRVDRKSYQLRYPGGSKTILYRRCRLEKFAPYSQRNGIIFRLTYYNDLERTDPIDVLEKFSQREDKLLERYFVVARNEITETFDHGRLASHLAEHRYFRGQTAVQTNRTMTFYHKSRVDGLQRREQTASTMTEYYVGRADRMCYREVLFGAKIKKFGPGAMAQKDAERGTMVCVTTTSKLNIDRIIERFTRDQSLSADDDVYERAFYIAEDRIYLTYHIGEDRIAPCTREFFKPPPSDDRRNTLQIHPDTHATFQVDILATPKTQVEIYNMLVSLLQEEQTSKAAVRQSEAEIRAILTERSAEELDIGLEIDLFDTLRNEKAHQLRLELEWAAEEERNRCKEVELDYLAPFLAQIEIMDGQLSREQAFALREECLQDLKQRLITKANIIQARFERETEKLQEKQQWFQMNQIHLGPDDEQEYIQFCTDVSFRITTLETMLAKHKQIAPQRYMAMERKLRSDPRLSDFLQIG